MKLLSVLLALLFPLCLGLTACGKTPTPTGAPVKESNDPETSGELLTQPAVLQPPEGAGPVPELVLEDPWNPQVKGPSGAVPATFFLGAYLTDPIYADLDGDGAPELLYLCPGPTSGLFTEAVCVYGLEEGWPVCKAATLFDLRWGEPRLEQEEDQVFFTLTPVEWHTGGAKEREPLRLPVTLRDGQILLNNGDLPEGVRSYGWWRDAGVYGASFADLSRRVGEGAILNHWACLIWQESGPTTLPDQEQWVNTYAAVTDNGVTVTGLLCWQTESDGSSWNNWKGLEPIPPVEDPESLLRLTEEELTDRLGPCHFDMGSGVYLPCWFTEDGKLLEISMLARAENVTCLDLLTGETKNWALGTPIQVIPDEKDVPEDMVFISDGIPTVVIHLPRWQRFLDDTAQGIPDEITVRKAYEEETYDLKLTFDGENYHLLDGDRETVLPCLITSLETDPPASARFKTAVHYLLSQDPEMTHKRFFAHMVSSVLDPDFPETRSLFTIYDPAS